MAVRLAHYEFSSFFFFCFFKYVSLVKNGFAVLSPQKGDPLMLTGCAVKGQTRSHVYMEHRGVTLLLLYRAVAFSFAVIGL